MSELLMYRTDEGMTDVFEKHGPHPVKVCHQMTDSELRSYGWIGDLHGTLSTFREDFAGHVRRVDADTKLVQSEPDSQLKRARKVLAAFDEAFRLLAEYGFANVGPRSPIAAPRPAPERSVPLGTQGAEDEDSSSIG